MSVEPPGPRDDDADRTGLREHLTAATANPAAGTDQLAITVPADPAHIAGARHRLRDWAAKHRLPDDIRDAVLLSAYEALANSVEHAYRDTSPPGPVALAAHLTAAGLLTVTVSDQGRWRPPPADPGYRGRGLRLIHQLAATAQVQHDVGGTLVTMHWYLSSNRQSCQN